MHKVGVVFGRTLMEDHVLSLLCDPDTRFALELTGNNLRNTATGRIYPIRDGIPLFVSTVTGPNLKYQTLYDRIAPGYDLAERLYHWFTRKPNYRQEYLSELEIRPGARVLEVVRRHRRQYPAICPRDIDFYGLDISWGMLRKCQRNLLTVESAVRTCSRRRPSGFLSRWRRLTAYSMWAASTSLPTRCGPSRK